MNYLALRERQTQLQALASPLTTEFDDLLPDFAPTQSAKKAAAATAAAASLTVF